MLIRIKTPSDRIWIYCSALARDEESLWKLLSASDCGFVLEDSAETGEQLVLGKLQSIAECFLVTIPDDDELYELACELRDLLLLINANASAKLVEPEDGQPSFFRWSRHVWEP